LVLEDGLGELEDGRWAAFEVALIVARQNGKGSILEARELAGLFLFGEQLILHSAHEFKTAGEAFRRILTLVESSDDMRKRVIRVSRSNGEEGIEIRGGGRLRFVARSGGSGRGFSGDVVILDEAYNLSRASMAALLPTLSSRPNPQIWYTSSAPMPESEVLLSIRERGMAGSSKRLAFMEFSAPPDVELDDRGAWAMANPALGIRIPEQFIQDERDALDDEGFARERLSIPSKSSTDAVISSATWAALADPGSGIVGKVFLAVDVAPDRNSAAICAAGTNADGFTHIEVADYRSGTDWIVDRVASIAKNAGVSTVSLDVAGPAGSLVPALELAGLEVTKLGSREITAACGAFYDDAINEKLRHLGDEVLSTAVAGGIKRPLGDAWAWSRKKPTADICPLVAVTIARYAHSLDDNIDLSEFVW
jgi:phage terminase large subunit-like protein